MGVTYVLLCVVLLSLALTHVEASGNGSIKRKNIVFIMADDLGWNDVSLHGSDQIPTPNIDTLAYAGVALGRYYSHCICTPSRAALLTGKYAHTIDIFKFSNENGINYMFVAESISGPLKAAGACILFPACMQGYPLTNSEDRGLPITEKILPQYLKELGYATHLIGKWHVGSSQKKYLPTRRGFDTFFGHRGGYIDYYEYNLEETWNIGKVSGMGLFRNETAAWDVEGYITDVYNQEALSIIESHDVSSPLFLLLAHNAPHGSNDGAILQAPPHEVRAMRHVESPARRIFAATMKKLDDSVGDVIEALEEKGILNNTIIVFISDNGAITSGDSLNYGNNYPLRGLKLSPFEGGVRVTGTFWVPFELPNNLYTGYVHVTDWLPTLLEAIGASPPEGVDGINLWTNIITNTNSSRHEIFEIDDYEDFASIVYEDYKLVTGNVNKAYSNYQGGALLGVIGNAPDYTTMIKNSKAYKVFQKIGKSVNIEDIEMRNILKVVCEQETHDYNICYPEKGKVCLYNIKEDPCELHDLAEAYPEIVETLSARLIEEKKRLVPRNIPLFRDPRSKPALFNYTWDTFI